MTIAEATIDHRTSNLSICWSFGDHDTIRRATDNNLDILYSQASNGLRNALSFLSSGSILLNPWPFKKGSAFSQKFHLFAERIDETSRQR